MLRGAARCLSCLSRTCRFAELLAAPTRTVCVGLCRSPEIFAAHRKLAAWASPCVFITCCGKASSNVIFKCHLQMSSSNVIFECHLQMSASRANKRSNAHRPWGTARELYDSTGTGYCNVYLTVPSPAAVGCVQHTEFLPRTLKPGTESVLLFYCFTEVCRQHQTQV